MPKVSIILTSYNKPEFVGKAIEGILNQTFQDFELFIMDDNSDQETLDVIQKYVGDERIIFYKSDITDIKERAAKTRYVVLINEALSRVQGEYITYATDDNIYRPQRLELMTNFLDENPQAQIVYSGSKVTYLDEEKNEVKNIIRSAKKQTWLASCAVDHCSFMHRYEVLEKVYEKWGSFWDDDHEYYFLGDARFFWRLSHFWPFYPLEEILDDNYITAESLHFKLASQQKDSLLELLPQQGTCRELREYIKNLRKKEKESNNEIH